MKNFNVESICGSEVNLYCFVVVVAKRARAISRERNFEQKDDGTPVGAAVQGFIDNQWQWVGSVKK
ncbi:MAG: hypothetical protein LBJ83_00620 [Oscillospiraceae bacterium]|nr:hypothetical protein [Oscillospiraceae bacterium]